MKKLLGILLLLSVFSVYAANNNILCSIEYFYSDDGMLIGKAINGNRINYEYDLRGQLLSVKDTNGKVLESYTYDKVGNILSKTVNGKTTTYTYDKANQLISSTTDGKTTNYKYDAAGRMVQAGSKTYRYKYLDKVAEVRENGRVIAEFEYTVEGQVSTATYGDKTEEFMWDGLALIKRNDISYINEPYVTGGNPIIADNDVMFNDMLGNTVAINGKSVDMTAFGETENADAMFTGKPHVAELGYAFLFRNYDSSLGKWSTSDPLGYPDGWNNFAYCNNWVSFSIDTLGTDVYIMVKDEPGIGHAVGIVGNPQDGYRVVNYGGAGENVDDYNAAPHLTLKEAVAYLENQNSYTYNLIQKFDTTQTQDNLIYETIKALALDEEGNSTYDFPDNLILNCYSIIVILLNDHLSGVVAAEINPPLVAFYVNLTWPYDAIELDMSLVKKGLQE